MKRRRDAENSKREIHLRRLGKARRSSLPGALALCLSIPMPKRVATASDAVRFINAQGFCLLFPVKGIPLESLYQAAAQLRRGQRPKWDRYAELIWGWKDELPRRGRAYYAKCLRGRGLFISLEMLPQFLAMRGAPRAGDYQAYLSAGRISHDAAAVWRALAEHGPLATLELRHACRMESKTGNARYKKAMLELQDLLAVTHFGSEQETPAWPSSRLALTAAAFPPQAAAARRITPEAARAALAARYMALHPGAPPQQLAWLFRWTRAQAEAALAARPQG